MEGLFLQIDTSNRPGQGSLVGYEGGLLYSSDVHNCYDVTAVEFLPDPNNDLNPVWLELSSASRTPVGCCMLCRKPRNSVTPIDSKSIFSKA